MFQCVRIVFFSRLRCSFAVTHKRTHANLCPRMFTPHTRFLALSPFFSPVFLTHSLFHVFSFHIPISLSASVSLSPSLPSHFLSPLHSLSLSLFFLFSVVDQSGRCLHRSLHCPGSSLLISQQRSSQQHGSQHALFPGERFHLLWLCATRTGPALPLFSRAAHDHRLPYFCFSCSSCRKCAESRFPPGVYALCVVLYPPAVACWCVCVLGCFCVDSSSEGSFDHDSVCQRCVLVFIAEAVSFC